MRGFALSLVLIVALGGTLPAYAQNFDKGLLAAQSGDFKAALSEWTPLAERGDALAQYYVGLMHQNGQGVPKDLESAASWYERAAKQGLSDAQYNLAVMYDNGFGVQQNYKTAITWYERAAAQGDADAKYNLGKMYAKGLGVSKDNTQAYAYWDAAAQQGHMKARLKREALIKEMSPKERDAVFGSKK